MTTIVVNAGRAIITGRMFGTTPSQAEPKFVTAGTGAGSVAAGSTTLSTEVSESRVSGTSSQVTTSTTNDTHQVTGTQTYTGTKTLTNAGVFDASTTGNLYMAGDGLSIAVNNGDQVAWTMKVQFS